MKKPTPLATALIGVLSGVVCLGFAVLAHHVGLPLTDLQREMLIGGGGMCLLGGVVGARFMPTKGGDQ